MKKYYILAILNCLFVLCSCNKTDDLDWSPTLLSPIAFGKLGINSYSELHNIPCKITFQPNLSLPEKSVVDSFSGKSSEIQSYIIKSPKFLELSSKSIRVTASFENSFQFPISAGMTIVIQNSGDATGTDLLRHITNKIIYPGEKYEFEEQALGLIIKPELKIWVENIGTPGSNGKPVGNNNSPLIIFANFYLSEINHVVYPAYESEKFSSEVSIDLRNYLDNDNAEFTIMLENTVPLDISLDINFLDINKKNIGTLSSTPIILGSNQASTSIKISDPKVIASLLQARFISIVGNFDTGNSDRKITNTHHVGFKIIAKATPNL